MNKYILLFLFFVGGFCSAQDSIGKDLDKTSFLLGMLEYPKVKFPDDSEFSDMITGFSCEDLFLKNLFDETVQSLSSNYSVSIKKENNAYYIMSKGLSDEIDSYLIYIPYAKKDMLKDEFKNINLQEGFINPYVFSHKQQESFMYGMVISKAEVNENSLNKTDNKTEGQYKMKFSGSSSFYSIVSNFMENSGYRIIASSSIRKSPNEKNDYEFFEMKIEFNVPESLRKNISDIIEKRDQSINENNCN